VGVASTVDGGTVGGERRRWWTLGAVSLGLFMIMLDNTVVNVALPSIERDLGMSLSQLEWVVTGYALTFAAFMLTGGNSPTSWAGGSCSSPVSPSSPQPRSRAVSRVAPTC